MTRINPTPLAHVMHGMCCRCCNKIYVLVHVVNTHFFPVSRIVIAIELDY